MQIVNVKDIKIGGDNPLVLIAGPCVIEDEKSTMKIAEEIKNITDGLTSKNYQEILIQP